MLNADLFSMTTKDIENMPSVFAQTRNSIEVITKQLMAIKALPIDMLEARGPMLMELASACIEAGYIECKPLSRQPINQYDGATESTLWSKAKSFLLDTAGFKLRGSGHFSLALSHPLLPSRVIKVGLKKEDSGAAYAAFCRANEGMEGLPHIYAMQRHARCYTVLLDELREMDEEDEAERIDYDYAMSRRLLINDIKDRKGWSDFYDTTAERDAINKELRATVDAIYRFFLGVATFDMHEGNVMIHPKTGKLIITDPISFSKVGNVEALNQASFSTPEEFMQVIESERDAKLRAEFKRRHERKHIARFNPEQFKARKAFRRMQRKVNRHAGLSRQATKEWFADHGVPTASTRQAINVCIGN